MKIAIVGAGAMGSVFGGLLCDAGHEVWLIDTWAEHIDAIRRNGLRVSGASGDRTVRPHATTDPREPGTADLVIIATKTLATRQAARDAAPLLGSETLLLTLQNGLGNGEAIAAERGSENLIIGTAGGFGASIQAPGHTHHEGMELIGLGEFGGGESERLERVAAVFRDAGFSVRTHADVHTVIWGKLLRNVAANGVAAITGLRSGQIRDNPAAMQIIEHLVREAVAVAEAKGIRLPYDDPMKIARDFGTLMPAARPSMLQDMLAGRLTEIDALNGAIVRQGAALGIPTPFNESVTLFVQALQEKAQRYGNAYTVPPAAESVVTPAAGPAPAVSASAGAAPGGLSEKQEDAVGQAVIDAVWEKLAALYLDQKSPFDDTAAEALCLAVAHGVVAGLKEYAKPD